MNNQIEYANPNQNAPKGTGIKLVFLFLQIIIYMICIYCFSYGNSNELGQPYDSEKQPCGVGVGLDDYKYIYFTNPDPHYLWRTICVKECPQLQQNQSESNESLSLACHPNAIINACDNRPSVVDPQYRVLYYNSVPYMNVCLPTKPQYLEIILPGLYKPLLVRILSDIYNGSSIILAAVLFCLICNLIQLSIIHWIPEYSMLILLLFTFLSIASTAGLGYIFSTKIMEHNQLDIHTLNLNSEQILGYVHSHYVYIDLILYFTYGLAGLLILLVLFVILKRNDIKSLGFKLKVVNDYISVCFQEILFLTLILSVGLFLFFVLWIWIAFNITTISKPKPQYNLMPFNYFQLELPAMILLGLHSINLIIIPRLVLSSHLTILMGKVVEIFHASRLQNLQQQNRQQQQLKHIGNVIGNFIRSTFSTVLIGELCQLFLEIFLFPLHLIQQMTGCSFCSTITRYNDRAYYQAYQKNTNFSESALAQSVFDSEKLKQNNKLHHHGNLYTFIIAITMSNLSASLTYALLTFSPLYNEIHNPLIFILIVYIFTYIISKLFGQMYGMSVECLIIVKQQLDEQQERHGDLHILEQE